MWSLNKKVMKKYDVFEPHAKRRLKPKVKPVIHPFENNIRRYDEWFNKHSYAYLSELNAISRFLPKKGIGIEVGLGTGRFAEPCGIKEGVEPSSAMRKIAMKKGIDVINGNAEHLPYKDLRYDFVLIVTICYLNNVLKALKEAYRVLKREGRLIVCFIEKDSIIGRDYISRKDQDEFYQTATFYTYDHVVELLKTAAFKIEAVNQTLFDPLNEIQDLQDAKEGHGEGSFIVINAIRKE